MGRLDEDHISSKMRAALGGDQSAYRNVLETLVPTLRHMAQRIAPQTPEDIQEDLVQEILTSIHAKRHTWQQTKPILPWIYAIARHRVIDHLRKEKRSPKTVSDLDDIMDSIAAPNPSVDLQHDIEQGIRSLNTQTEAVVRAMAVDGKDAKQAAEELGITENAARIAFHRGLKKLRVFLSDYVRERP